MSRSPRPAVSRFRVMAVAKPEDVGLSSKRLQRINQLVQRYMDAGEITGAVTNTKMNRTSSRRRNNRALICDRDR